MPAAAAVTPNPIPMSFQFQVAGLYQLSPVGSLRFAGSSSAYVYGWPVWLTAGSTERNWAVEGS